jgi:phosphoglycerate dehydrogenase-like enzyme
MKPTAIVANTSRGPIIDEAAMVAALQDRRIHAACLDVYDTEPLPADHVLRRLDNTVITPHLGYVTQANFRTYYADTVEAINAWRAGAAIPRLIEN